MNEFLLLAHKYDSRKHGLAGNLVSEKLDGQRCFWDGGITRGMKVSDVPWANTYDRRKQSDISTGLWSRLGNVIHAPESWLATLPNIMLDGELYMPGHRQDLMSIIKTIIPGPGWKDVKYFVYDTVPVDVFLNSRTVTYSGRKQPIHIDATINPSGEYNSVIRRAATVLRTVGWKAGFRSRHVWLRERFLDMSLAGTCDPLILHIQHELPMCEADAKNKLDCLLEAVLSTGGEGLVLRLRDYPYETTRSWGTLKIKPTDDSEGTVVGWVAGEETDKGSRLLGKMGSLIISVHTGPGLRQELRLSGFTDEERELEPAAARWARNAPGQSMTMSFGPGYLPCKFQHGTIVTFTYRGRTADGLPMEARYLRRRLDD